MTKLENKVSELDRMVASKSQALAQSQQPSGRVTGTYKPVGAEVLFTMTNFDQYKRGDDSWYSPHFYTHRNGYKLSLLIDANGRSHGKGTHLSVFVYLMPGEFDDQLKWPFQAKISIKLVNQEEDRDHVMSTIDFGNAPSHCCERVMTKGRIENGFGHGRFLSHAGLQPNYLKNDYIKLCVKKVEFY
jgi:hypothetical protein